MAAAVVDRQRAWRDAGSVEDRLMRVMVILPAHNEAGNVTPLVNALLAAADGAKLDTRVLVVNDGSGDGTAAELAELSAQVGRLTVVTHRVNRGFAQALRTGIAAAREAGCDAAVFMDCDLSHRPEDFPRMIAAIESGADVVLGSRFVPGGGMVGVPAWRVAISRMGNLFGRVVLGIKVRDMTTGYRAMSRRVLDALTLTEDGFTIQLEAVVKAAAAGFTIAEVPIILSTRRHGVSHMYYSPELFARYYRLLMKCRQWLREGRCAAAAGR
jgi:dolichol-phosphate mannosyltransferase